MNNALILLAGGTGKRLNNSKKIPKQFIKFQSYNLIEYFLQNLDQNIFEIIQIVVKPSMQKKYLSKLKKEFFFHKINFVTSGNNRQKSSKNGIFSLRKINPKKVLIHDAARPLADNQLIKKLIKELDQCNACSPYIKHNDYIKYKLLNSKIDNNVLYHIQTPQAFNFKSILKAHTLTSLVNSNDDISLTENINIKTKYIKGKKTNFKITYKDDIELFNRLKIKIRRHGIGYDIHKINTKSKKKLTLCGVKISHPPLIGHSDADVGYHAICDSILGALSMRDIGYHFNNKNKKWKNANSKIFMKFCYQQLKRKKFIIVNLDINFICEKPNINKHAKKMINNISNILNLDKTKVTIKAKTNEKIIFIGNNEGIAAESIVQIQNE